VRHLAFVCAAVCAVAPAARGQEPASPNDVTSYPVVHRVPGMAQVVVKADLPYAEGVRLDLYLPPPTLAAGPWPAVVFVNGVGDFGDRRLKNWEIYRSWARLMAAHGVAAVTMEAEAGRTAERLAQLVDQLSQGRFDGVDPKRIALWACSANVATALPYAMAKAPLRAAVIYYGAGETPAPRKDLPILYVMAGKDSPNLNAGIRRSWAAAMDAGVPWTMVLAPELPHAFDALVETAASRDLVKDTVTFLVRNLAPAQPAPKASPARQALTYSFGNEWAKAADAYAALLKEAPGDRDLLRWYGRALARSGRTDEAIQTYRREMEQGSDDIQIHQELANLLLEQKRYADAVAEYDAVLARGGAAGPPNFNAACALALAGRKDDAFARLEKAVAANYGTRDQYASDEDLASLRTDARFAALLARLSP